VNSSPAPRSSSSNVSVSSSASSGPVTVPSGVGGGGGAPGGGGDFALVLQDAAKPGLPREKGATVAEFDRQNMLNRLDDYRASVAQMQASMRKLQADLEVARNSHAQQSRMPRQRSRRLSWT
jgi:hypothetical protein